MQRDMRVRDNWALLYAADLARERHAPLTVCFALAPSFCGATLRAYDFLLRGLQEVESDLRRLHIGFVVLEGDPPGEICRLIHQLGAAVLVTDFNPIRPVTAWKTKVASRIDIQMVEVDAHNVVPAWVASDHREWSAATLRRKMDRLVQTWLVDIPALHALPSIGSTSPTDWSALRSRLACDESVQAVGWCTPGRRAGMRRLSHFCEALLPGYVARHNDPVEQATSMLSPWLHFGHLSAQRVALEAQHMQAPVDTVHAFLEQLIVRRELADNWCLYNPDYDSVTGFPAWAQQTLALHANDPRQHTYLLPQLDEGATHDPLWNAAQRHLRVEGYLHGYLRMYWAKQLLLWTTSAAEALADVLWLNDRYELDGRDPNGYVGAAWSIGGVHDRPWPQRPVFGSVRSMTLAGARSKFDVEKYIADSPPHGQNGLPPSRE
jgi:deoxyribodipyrimidine photo-lyase